MIIMGAYPMIEWTHMRRSEMMLTQRLHDNQHALQLRKVVPIGTVEKRWGMQSAEIAAFLLCHW